MDILFEKYRKQSQRTQQEMATALGVSRPTYAQIEKGKIDMTLPQLQKFAELVGVSLIDLIGPAARLQNAEVLILKEPATAPAPALQIRVPEKKLHKFSQVILYILERVGARPNVGETVLYKLLYFIDFDYYEKFEETLIGATYIKNHHGPTPAEFPKVIDAMISNDEVEAVKSDYFSFQQKKYLPHSSADLRMLSAQEVVHIDEVLCRLAHMSAKEISAYSHEDIPWKSHALGEVISYESVFYRDEKYSVRHYDDEL